MPSAEKNSTLPIWLLSGAIVIAVLVIGYFAWHEFARGSAGAPDKTVHPGMYDFRKEAQNGNLGRHSNAR